MITNYRYASWKNPEESSDYGDAPVIKGYHKDYNGRYQAVSRGGQWCPSCREKGRYSWISTDYCSWCNSNTVSKKIKGKPKKELVKKQKIELTGEHGEYEAWCVEQEDRENKAVERARKRHKEKLKAARRRLEERREAARLKSIEQARIEEEEQKRAEAEFLVKTKITIFKEYCACCTLSSSCAFKNYATAGGWPHGWSYIGVNAICHSFIKKI